MINCLQRSYQFEEPVSLSWLISQISQLVVYPINDEISTHQVLYRDLLKLVAISSEIYSSDYIGTIQMLGHLRYCLEEFITRFPEQASPFSSLQEYKNLRKKIDKLQQSYPYERKFGDTRSSVVLLTEPILQILFPNNQIKLTQNSFQLKLESLLNQYTKPIRQILDPVLLLNEKKIKITFKQNLRDDVKIVFDDNSIGQVFKEVAENLEKLRTKNIEKNNDDYRSSDLYSSKEYNYKIPVEIGFGYDVNNIEIRISNECTIEEKQRFEAEEGSGIHQIEVAMDKLGYKFEPYFEKIGTKWVFIQPFKLRRL